MLPPPIEFLSTKKSAFCFSIKSSVSGIYPTQTNLIPKKRRLKPTIQRKQTLHANRLVGPQELTRGQITLF